MKKIIPVSAFLLLLSFGAISQAQSRSEGDVASPFLNQSGVVVTSTTASLTDSQGQPVVSAPGDLQRLNAAAYLLLEQENKPHCRIASKFQTTGNVSHSYWFGSDSKKRLEDEVVFLNQNSDQAKHWLECE
jgi:hypothetical protein